MFTTEIAIRLGFFTVVFLIVAVAELLMPRRRLVARKPVRWASNLALAGINAVAVRLLVPVSAVGIASLSEQHGWGLLNNITIRPWLAILVSVAALDFFIYLQHVLFHAVPVLWRLHMVHHADLDFDVTTGLRFHTLEILLSKAIKLAAILVLGPPPGAVLTFEVLLNATSVFSHTNLQLPNTSPEWGDKLLLVRIFAWDQQKKDWENEPIAISDRGVSADGRLWQHNLVLLASPGSQRQDAWRRGDPSLPAGRYLVKIYVDAKDVLAKEWNVSLGEADLVGQTEFTSRWPKGYGQMTVIDLSKRSAATN